MEQRQQHLQHGGGRHRPSAPPPMARPAYSYGGEVPSVSVSDVDEEEDRSLAHSSDDEASGEPAPPAPRVFRRAKRGGKQGATAAGARLLLSKLEKAGYRADVEKALAAAGNNPDAAVRLVPAALVEAARGITGLDIGLEGKFKATVDAAKLRCGNCWLKTWQHLKAHLPAAKAGLERLYNVDGDLRDFYRDNIALARAASKGCWITAWMRLSRAIRVMNAVVKMEGGDLFFDQELDKVDNNVCKTSEIVYSALQRDRNPLRHLDPPKD